MNRRRLLSVLTGCVMASGLAAAQGRRDVPTLGILWLVDRDVATPYLNAFKDGLRELGWIEGRTIRIIERYDAGDVSRRPELAAELVTLGVNILYVTDPALAVARNATKTIPIVCADFYDPIAEGVTTSMAKPDGNVTGISWQSAETAGKRLQLVLELKPSARRIGLITDASDAGARIELRGFLAVARQARITIEKFDLHAPEDVEPVLARVRTARLDALIVSANTLTWPVIDTVVQVATGIRIPVISEPEDFAKAGAVITYGVDVLSVLRRSATFVDRILKGATPADLPIEEPTRFNLVVNLRAAKAVGLAVPQSILQAATRIIR